MFGAAFAALPASPDCKPESGRESNLLRDAICHIGRRQTVVGARSGMGCKAPITLEEQSRTYRIMPSAV